MATKTIPFKVYGTMPGDKLAVVIEQVATGFLFDPVAKTFKPIDQIADPLLPIPPGKDGTVLSSISRVDIPLDGKWLDGRYSASYFNVAPGAAPRPFNEDIFDIWQGEWRPFTSTDLAWRILDSRANDKTGTTVRQCYAKIEAIYDWVSKQPGFVAAAAPQVAADEKVKPKVK